MSRSGIQTHPTRGLFPTLLLVLLLAGCVTEIPTVQPEFSQGGIITLPPPDREGGVSVETAIAGRRSVREFREFPLDFAQVGQILWAAQGITLDRGPDEAGLRAAPSAGALYPLEVYLVDGRVVGLPAGVYRYLAASHALQQISQGDERHEVWRAAGEQDAVRDAPATLVITGVYARTTAKYGERGRQYVHMEAGHASQNVYLQCEALDLVTVAIGALDEAALREVLRIPEEETPLYLMPVGRPVEMDAEGHLPRIPRMDGWNG